MKLPIITLHRPWADWVALGWKEIETRTHNRFQSLCRRRVGIHAGMRWDRKAADTADHYMISSQHDQIYNSRDSGRIICTVFVEHFRLLAPPDAARAMIECDSVRYGLFLINPRLTPDEPWTRIKGAQGIQYVEVPEGWES